MVIMTIDFGKPFERISMHDAVVKYGNIPAEILNLKHIDETIKKHNITVDPKVLHGVINYCSF